MKQFKINSFLILLSLVFVSTQTFADDLISRSEIKAGIEINFLWAVPPFKTYEIRVFTGVAPDFEISLGYGRQNWNYEGDALTKGSMKSDALIIGGRYFVGHSRAFIDYSAWIMSDALTTPEGKLLTGPSLSHEFFGGYQFGNGNFYWSPGMNLGFYSYRPYTPNDDRFKITLAPKVVGGVEFK